MAEFLRARSNDAKQARELAILDAARRLGVRDGVRTVTLTGIAEEVGLHKSGLLRYFETREQIFLRLAAAEWSKWGSAVVGALDGAASAREVGESIASSLVARPFFCDLLGHVPLSLERNVSSQAVIAFKLVTHAQVDAITAALMRALPDLSPRDCVDVISTAVSTAGALWQMSTPGKLLAEVYRQDARLAHAIVDFEPTLARILSALLAGLVAQRRPPSGAAASSLDR